MIDSFPFFNELDLLEIRLNSLAPYVDKFILCEMPVTHSGKPKPLFFEENKDRYRDFNIVHLVAPPIEGASWTLERYQREYLMQGINEEDPEEILLMSDLDEIPDLDSYNGGEGVFSGKLYYYYFNVRVSQTWNGTVAVKIKNIKTLNRLRKKRHRFPVVGNAWHFSTLGTPDEIKYKIESFAHIELDKPEYKDKIASRRARLVDMYERGSDSRKGSKFQLSEEMPNGPQWLLENKERYSQLWLSSNA